MGLVVKTQPIGVDKTISKINEHLYSHLINDAKWLDYDAYHRAYRNESKDGVIPEAYTAQSVDTNDYHDVRLNDNVNATSFFLVDETIDLTGSDTDVNISVIYQVNVKELYDVITHRADEEARNDVIVALKRNPYVKEVNSIVTGIDNVYTGFRTDDVKWDDMNPYHVFKVDMTVRVFYDCDWVCQYVPEATGFNYVSNFALG